MTFDWCCKCDAKHDLDEPCEVTMDTTITTNLEATAQLYRAMVYCQDMAYRQRTDARRVAYNDAFVILRDALRLIDRIERSI
jgi:hypothetical protein